MEFFNNALIFSPIVFNALQGKVRLVLLCRAFADPVTYNYEQF